MPKKILIFSDGTGQIGGIRPDQRLSNIYKMYRAMRSGPDSKISPKNQVTFYDPGLGAGEIGGITLKRLRNIFASAVGTGISENMIDCYEAIISNYEPGDKIFLFGFSRGAYTARCVANVMNLCGVPTEMPDGTPVPKYGPRLRSIARDAVLFVYEHGSGYPRDRYEKEREQKASRFREKYGSQGNGADGEAQGNVQPFFIGAFDTVAALGSGKIRNVCLLAMLVIVVMTTGLWIYDFPWALRWPSLALTGIGIFWVLKLIWKQLKYFRASENTFPHSFHFAAWKLRDYDRFLDNKVRFARHALSIDENRKNFPHVTWASPIDVQKNKQLLPAWIKQCWFAGNHSDIGGSYPEPESRLSDIALGWMIDELKEADVTIEIDDSKLNLFPDSNGLQHDEVASLQYFWPSWLPSFVTRRLTWPIGYRKIDDQASLHPTVYERLKQPCVSILGDSVPYRPCSIQAHHHASEYFD